MSRSSEWALREHAEDVQRQELAEREQHYFGLLLSKDRLGPSKAEIMAGKACPYCNGGTVYVDSSEVYGRSYGMIYLCRKCKTYVGVHKGTNKALGRLADAELREWKKLTHARFDPIWKGGQMGRGDLYRWLAKRMDLHPDDCHIGMFDVKQCKLAFGLLEEWNVAE